MSRRNRFRKRIGTILEAFLGVSLQSVVKVPRAPKPFLRPPDKALTARIPGVCARIATPSAGMQGRSNAVMTFATGCLTPTVEICLGNPSLRLSERYFASTILAQEIIPLRHHPTAIAGTRGNGVAPIPARRSRDRRPSGKNAAGAPCRSAPGGRPAPPRSLRPPAGPHG